MDAESSIYTTTLPFLTLVWLCDHDSQMGAGHVQAWEQFFKQTKNIRCTQLRASADKVRESFTSNWTSYVKSKKPIEDSELLLEFRKAGDHYGETGKQQLREDILACAKAIVFSMLPGAERQDLNARYGQLEALFALQGADAPASPASSQAAKNTASNAAQPNTSLPFWTGGKLPVVCRGVYAETDDVKTFRFQSLEGHWFGYKPGQFTTLDLKINGKKIRRSYTISSSPSRPMSLDITVKRVPGGLVSNWLHDNMQPGMEINIMGPGGEFTCADHDVSKIILISAGSGVTPCMSMARYLCDTAAPVDVVFIHSARSPGDIIFRQECEQYAASRSNFRYIVTCTRPAPCQPWSGLTGRLSQSMLEAAIPDYKERTAYLCGPEPFMLATKKLFEESGFPMANFYEESFGGAPAPKKQVESPPKALPAQEAPVASQEPEPEAAGEASFPVTFDSSGVTLDAPADEFILDIAEENGIEIPSSCRQGNCGTCKVRKLEGEIECDADAGLSDADREEGYILTCCSTPKSALKLEA